MEHITHLLDFVLNLSDHLAPLVAQLGVWIYLILFCIIFAETGLIILPFLPGDSLLFVAGSVATFTSLDVHLLAILLIVAGILGNTVNYSMGRWIGRKLFCHPDSKIFSHKKLESAHEFYEKHGASAVILSRFLPIIRTFVPFVAGMAEMTYTRFTVYNIVGAVAWVCLFVYGGYFFGRMPFVQAHLGSLILGIMVLTVLPIVVQVGRSLLKK
jgi:membrane-associated protein